MWANAGDGDDEDGVENSADLANLPVEELLKLRADIDKLLPATAMKDLDLEKELVIQFQVAKALQTETLASKTEEANRKAQVANTTASILQQLIKMQAEFHTAERLKNIESRLIRCLEKVPEQYLLEFFEWYENGAK